LALEEKTRTGSNLLLAKSEAQSERCWWLPCSNLNWRRSNRYS